MAELIVEGEDLVLRLPLTQKVLGFHGNLTVPLGAVRTVRPVEKPWLTLRGRRMAGTAMRGVAAVGTWIHGDRRYDFCVIRRTQPAVLVELNAGRFDRFIVGLPEGSDPVAEADRLAAAAGVTRGEPLPTVLD